MTPDQFVAFVQGKLAEHGAAKMVPDHETLARAYAAFAVGKRASLEISSCSRSGA